MKSPYNFAQIEILSNSNKLGKLYKIIFSLLIIGILIILYKFKFQVYEKITLINENNKFTLITNVEEIPFIENNKSLKIQNKNYNYSVISIDKNYTSFNSNIYQTATININNFKTDAYYVTGYILKSNQTILEMLIEFIGGGSR